MQTTERYLGCKQSLGHPVNDLFDLRTDGQQQAQQVESDPVDGASEAIEKKFRQGIECGVEISDLVAAIAPVSGQLEGQQTAPPPVLTPGNARAPISVQEWAGTLDEVLWPCGYGTTKYNRVLFWLDTVDDTFNHWVKQVNAPLWRPRRPFVLEVQPIRT